MAATKTWQAAAWYLERRYNREFGIKQITELQGQNGEPIKLNIITGADFSQSTTFIATPAGGSSYGSAPVQGFSMAPQSEENDNSNKPISKVDTT